MARAAAPPRMAAGAVATGTIAGPALCATRTRLERNGGGGATNLQAGAAVHGRRSALINLLFSDV